MKNKKPFNSLIDSEEIYHKSAPTWPYYLALIVVAVVIAVLIVKFV